jgi:hypothetical protein
MVLIDSQDGGLKALRALPIRAAAASHEALKREKPPTRQGQRLYSKRLATPAKGRPGTNYSPETRIVLRPAQPSWCDKGEPLRTVTDQSFNPIDRCYPCPRTSNSRN